MLDPLERVLAEVGSRVVACSGGLDSLLLATIAHRLDPDRTVIAHAVSPAVPGAASARIAVVAASERWTLKLVTATELDDERYLANPTDRCYFCKSHLYEALDLIARSMTASPAPVVLSGANCDDLADYRPGLVAAAEWSVRHPFIEASFGKAEIRALARELGLSFADLPASPCLASRLYTGTRVTATRLRAVDAGEELIRLAAGVEVVRCRLRGNRVLVEVPGEERGAISATLLEEVASMMRAIEPAIEAVDLDTEPYRPGRAVRIPVRATFP